MPNSVLLTLYTIISTCCLCTTLAQFSLLSASDFDSALTDHTREFSKATNFTLSDMKRLLRNKCIKVGVSNENIYEDITDAAVQLRRCTEGLLNITQLYVEIETARPVGALDEVFEKYCNRRSLLDSCLQEFNTKLQPCLSAGEQTQNSIVLKMIDRILEFFCYRNGSPLSMFIAESGPECIESHKHHVLDCVYTSLRNYLPNPGTEFALDELPELVLKPKQCLELHEIEHCVLKHLETCDESTPVSMAEAIFRYVMNETNCRQEIEKFEDASLRTPVEIMPLNSGALTLTRGMWARPQRGPSELLFSWLCGAVGMLLLTMAPLLVQ